ncbi:N-acetyltransferase [Flavobacteriaceae sp. LMIT009]
MIDAAELIDNTFLRQFQMDVEGELATIEYSLQDRKIFLTKLVVPENADDNEFVEDFLRLVMENIQDRNISVVPTAPPIAKFIRRNRRYKSMLPVGVRI